MSRSRARVLLLSCFVAACGTDRSRPPDRASPELETIDGASPPFSAIVDRMRTEPTWLDPSTFDVLRLRGGVVESVVGPVVIPEGASALRVFDDGTMAIATPDSVHLYDAGSGVASALAVPIGSAFDGTSIHDLWIAQWSPPGDPELCRHTPAGAECVVIPSFGGFPPDVALAPDGSVYVTDLGVDLTRLADGVLTPVALGHGGLLSFRRSGEGLFALAHDGTLFVVDGDRVEARGTRFLRGVVGSADDHYELRFDSEEINVDPACQTSFLRPCERRLLWSENVVVRVRGGVEEEITHETCDGARAELCARAVFGLGLDGDRVVVMGTPFRWLP